MENLLIYLLKVSAGITIFYLSYLLLFRKDTFYLRNRIFLIVTLLLPTILAAIKIPAISSGSVPLEPISYSLNSDIFRDIAIENAIPGTVSSFDYAALFTHIYFIIAGILLLRMLISLVSTYRIIKNGTVKSGQFPKIVIPEISVPPFSFFPYAVIPEGVYNSGDYTDLLDHEFAHIRQGHTFDLFMGELFIIFQWFNPLVWMVKRSILLNHEFLADHVSLLNNKRTKEYQYRLINFQAGLKHISLAHNFNSLIKNRIIMINKKPTRKYATLKNIIILPVAALVIYAFATPEYNSVSQVTASLTPFQAEGIIQQEVKGIVFNEDGAPLGGVNITSTGAVGNAFSVTTATDGRFSISSVQSNGSLLFYCRGYKRLTLKPDFSKEMIIKMEKDPENKAQTVAITDAPPTQRPRPLVVIDGVISDKSLSEAIKDLGYDMGISKMINGKEATDKYGEKASDGVYEITTRKKTLEMGLKPPFPRLAPGDYPTFHNQRYSGFSDWVVSHVKYPAEAREKKQEGWVTVNFTVELDGTIDNVKSTSSIDPILSNEVIRVVQSSPKWEPPKNPDVDEPFSSSVTLQFMLPDQVSNEPPFVVVEKMPMYPGGDKELLNFIKSNTRYPEEARAEKIEGKVIVRFIVNTEGKAQGISVLKGVNPLLDAEAVRVVSMLSGFEPGMQGGKAVNVWYMVPVNFSLAAQEPAK